MEGRHFIGHVDTLAIVLALIVGRLTGVRWGFKSTMSKVHFHFTHINLIKCLVKELCIGLFHLVCPV